MNSYLRTLLRLTDPPTLLRLARNLAGADAQVRDSEVQRLHDAFVARNRGCPEDEIVLREGLRIPIHPHSRDAFEYFCYRAPQMVQELDTFLEKTKDRRHFLDVGALHGIFSLAFARQDQARRAIAVDASPVAFARLLYNVHRHPFQNITPVEIAFSDRAGVLRMHYEWEHAVSAGTAGSKALRLCAKMTTGDQWCERNRFRPDVIKIDVEGHEVRVVRGLRATLERDRPLVFLEIHPERIQLEGDDVRELATIFRQSRYGATHVDGSLVDLESLTTLKSDLRVVLTPTSG